MHHNTSAFTLEKKFVAPVFCKNMLTLSRFFFNFSKLDDVVVVVAKINDFFQL